MDAGKESDLQSLLKAVPNCSPQAQAVEDSSREG